MHADSYSSVLYTKDNLVYEDIGSASLVVQLLPYTSFLQHYFL